MSAHNFWNNFNFGFLNGLMNSNPFGFGCGGFSVWSFNQGPFNSVFTSVNMSPMPMMMNNSFNIFAAPTPILYTPDILDYMESQKEETFVDRFVKAQQEKIEKEKLQKENPEDDSTNTSTSASNDSENNSIEAQHTRPKKSRSAENNDDRQKITAKETAPIIYDNKTQMYRPNFDSTTPNKHVEKVVEHKSEEENYTAQTLQNKWKKVAPHLSSEFYAKVIKISKNINCNPDDLMALMNSESTLNHQSENSIGAVGLIQFTKTTREGFGVTKEELIQMTPEKQLDYVEKYFINANGKKARLRGEDLYALCFLPKYAGQEILTVRGKKSYSQNKGLDVNGDGKITKTDLAQRLDEKRA